MPRRPPVGPHLLGVLRRRRLDLGPRHGPGRRLGEVGRSLGIDVPQRDRRRRPRPRRRCRWSTHRARRRSGQVVLPGRARRSRGSGRSRRHHRPHRRARCRRRKRSSVQSASSAMSGTGSPDSGRLRSRFAKRSGATRNEVEQFADHPEVLGAAVPVAGVEMPAPGAGDDVVGGAGHELLEQLVIGQVGGLERRQRCSGAPRGRRRGGRVADG